MSDSEKPKERLNDIFSGINEDDSIRVAYFESCCRKFQNTLGALIPIGASGMDQAEINSGKISLQESLMKSIQKAISCAEDIQDSLVGAVCYRKLESLIEGAPPKIRDKIKEQGVSLKEPEDYVFIMAYLSSKETFENIIKTPAFQISDATHQAELITRFVNDIFYKTDSYESVKADWDNAAAKAVAKYPELERKIAIFGKPEDVFHKDISSGRVPDGMA